MTNREKLNSLSNDDFTTFLLQYSDEDSDSIERYEECFELNLLHDFTLNYTEQGITSRECLNIWLNKEFDENNDEFVWYDKN